jgi:hypothetical protein
MHKSLESLDGAVPQTITRHAQIMDSVNKPSSLCLALSVNYPRIRLPIKQLWLHIRFITTQPTREHVKRKLGNARTAMEGRVDALSGYIGEVRWNRTIIEESAWIRDLAMEGVQLRSHCHCIVALVHRNAISFELGLAARGKLQRKVNASSVLPVSPCQ